MAISKKVLLVGEPAVGKTSLVRRFVEQQFSDDYQSSIGVNVKQKNVAYHHNFPETPVELKLMIYDLQGQHGKKEPPYDSYMKGANGVMAVFDLARPETVDAIADFWVPRARKVAGHVPIYLVGNKHDLKPDVKMLGTAIAPILSKLKGERLDGLLTSAKTDENVEKAFYDLGKMILQGAK